MVRAVIGFDTLLYSKLLQKIRQLLSNALIPSSFELRQKFKSFGYPSVKMYLQFNLLMFDYHSFNLPGKLVLICGILGKSSKSPVSLLLELYSLFRIEANVCNEKHKD